MSLNLEEKKAVVAEVAAQVAVSQTVVVAEYRGIKVEDLKENLAALLDALQRAKPSSSKGIYFKRLSVSSTMGVGVRVDQASVSA